MVNSPFAPPYRGGWYNLLIQLQHIAENILVLVQNFWGYVNRPLSEIVVTSDGGVIDWLFERFLELFNIDPDVFTLLDFILTNTLFMIIFIIVLKGMISLLKIVSDDG